MFFFFNVTLRWSRKDEIFRIQSRRDVLANHHEPCTRQTPVSDVTYFPCPWSLSGVIARCRRDAFTRSDAAYLNVYLSTLVCPACAGSVCHARPVTAAWLLSAGLIQGMQTSLWYYDQHLDEAAGSQVCWIVEQTSTTQPVVLNTHSRA